MGHKICFYAEIWLIITELSLLPLLIWSTVASGNKLEGDMRDIVSLQAQTSSYFQLREKLKCIEHIDKSETQAKTSP